MGEHDMVGDSVGTHHSPNGSDGRHDGRGRAGFATSE